MSNHHRHAFPGGVKAKCVQQLEAQLPQVRQLHDHLVGEASDQGALVGPGSVDQSGLVGRLCLVAQLSFVEVPGGFSIVGWRDGAKSLLQTSRGLLLVQLGERALCRGRGQQAGAALIGGSVGDETGGAAAVGAGGQSAGGEAFDEVLDGLHWRL